MNYPTYRRGRVCRARQEKPIYAGVQISNPDRILYSDQHITKHRLAEYYMAVGDLMVPHIKGRPLTLVRCPHGWNEKCFFQKYLKTTMPPALRGIEIGELDSFDTYILADDVAGIISLVQMDILEIHTWGCTEKNIEQPDRVVMDFDPDESMAWEDTITGARQMRSNLEDLGLECWVKTSGGKGLHVVIPLTPKSNWKEVKAFAKALTDQMVCQNPNKYVGVMSKAKRKGKIYIDYLRNSRGATSIAAYSTRARAGAPISAPISWEELEPKLRADSFNIINMPIRVSKVKRDPWKGLANKHQTITSAIKRSLGLA